MRREPMKSRYAIVIIVSAELLGGSLWFSVNAVADVLQTAWGLSAADIGHLTSAVQLGFITGTLLLALSGLADRFSASRIFASCAILGALVNAAFAGASGHFAGALMLRFMAGMALAGVYPIGMKLVVSWAPDKAGHSLGWLVGMLALGTGLPHFIRGVGTLTAWQDVIDIASGLALVAAAMVAWLGDGPHHGSKRREHWGSALQAFRIPGFRAAALGYFGHMWELYAFWALVPWLMAHPHILANGHATSLAAFSVFVAGSIGCITGGMLSRYWPSGKIAIIALAGSALSCLIYPWAQALPDPVVPLLLLVWGFFVVADSPQFSALAANACPAEGIGGALALMNSIGFAITIVSIELGTRLWQTASVQVAWLLLPGPILGIIAMRTLWREK